MLRFNKFHATFSIIILVFIVLIHPPVYSMDPSEYDIVFLFTAPGPSPQGLAWDGTYLWVSDDSTDTIYKVNPSDSSVVLSFDSPGSDPKDLAWDGTNLWVVDGEEVTMYKLNPANGDTISSIHLEIEYTDSCTVELSGLAWDGSHLLYSYIITKDSLITFSNKIQRINPQTKEIDEYDLFATARGLAYDGNSSWYSSLRSEGYSIGATRKLAIPNYNTTAYFFTPGYYPFGLTWDGTYLWLADDVTNTIYKIELE